MPDMHEITIDIVGDNTLYGSYMMTIEQRDFIKDVFSKMEADGKYVPMVFIRDITEEKRINREKKAEEARKAREEERKRKEEERKHKEAEAAKHTTEVRSIWQAAFDKANIEKAAKEARRGKKYERKD